MSDSFLSRYHSGSNMLCLTGSPLVVPYPSYKFVLDESGAKVLDKEMLYEIDTTDNLRYRAKVLANAKNNPGVIEKLKLMCKQNILFYINTFCYTYRTDLSRKGKNPYVNVCTFPFQDDLLTWMVWTYNENIEGMLDKSREMGATWVWVWYESWLRLFHNGVTTLAMSQNESDVDDRTNKSIFEKTRINLRAHPEWLRGGWVENSPTDKMMAIKTPETKGEALGAVAKGSAGRSGRGSVVFYDEFAHIDEAPAMIESGSALSPCKFYVSTPKGDNNEFARMSQSPGVNKKTLNWDIHPLRNELWEKKKRAEPSMTEEVFAQEYEVSYTKSNIGRVYPSFNISPVYNEGEWSHVGEGKYYEYDPSSPVYTAMDFGRDMTYVGYFQIKNSLLNNAGLVRQCFVFFDEYSISNATAYDVRREVNGKGYNYGVHIGDMRTAVSKDSMGRGWGYYLQEDARSIKIHHNIDVGPPIEINGSFRSPSVYIDTVSTLLNTPGAICWNKNNCPIGINSMSNWSYEVKSKERDMHGRPMLKDNPNPKHDRFSHPGTAIYYGIYYAVYHLTGIRKESKLDWSRFRQSFPAGL